MDHAAVLAKTFLFRDMPARPLAKLAKVANEQRFQAHTVLFNEGDAGAEFFVIVHGSVKIYKNDSQNEREEVATLGSGSYFGEMALVAEDHRRTATVETQELSIVLSFDQEKVVALCENDHEFGFYFFRAVARGLERRLRASTHDATFYRELARAHR